MLYERITKAFRNGKALISFLTGGDPSIEKTEEFILQMIAGGTDIIEIGIPFSDPIAEAPVIQEANLRSLQHDTDIDKIFALVTKLRPQTQLPIVFLTYLNPVFVYGYERFFSRCAETGADGIIVPDLPFEEHDEVCTVAERYGIALISVIAPASEQRIQEIAKHAVGFLYAVPSLEATRVQRDIKEELSDIIATVRAVSDIPVAVGLDSHTPTQAAAIAKISDGVITGSTIAELIEHSTNDVRSTIFSYTKQMKEAIQAYGE